LTELATLLVLNEILRWNRVQRCSDSVQGESVTVGQDVQRIKRPSVVEELEAGEDYYTKL
jgi:hypothetical protein